MGSDNFSSSLQKQGASDVYTLRLGSCFRGNDEGCLFAVQTHSKYVRNAQSAACCFAEQFNPNSQMIRWQNLRKIVSPLNQGQSGIFKIVVGTQSPEFFRCFQSVRTEGSRIRRARHRVLREGDREH